MKNQGPLVQNINFLNVLSSCNINPGPAEPGLSAFSNSIDPDQLASEANWSGSALFVIQYVNLYQQPGWSYLIGWQLEVGMAS